jgi:beta-lactamase superfamily II metal-dependent hydrolase
MNTISAPAGHICIRMYNVGFGDSFLIAFPAPDRPRIVLIDCGVHSAGPGPRRIAEVAQVIFDDLPRIDNKPRIDIVVGTHRHKDHVSGFESEVWREVEVGQVWMPWTEDPDDGEATRIREGQQRTARHISSYMEKKVTETKTSLAERQRLDPRRIARLESRVDLALNSLTNEKAMRTLHHGFLGEPKRLFLPDAERKNHSFTLPDLLPGVTAHIMGPSRNEECIREMEPPTGQSFLRALANGESGDEVFSPFPKEDWALTPIEFAIEASHLKMTSGNMKYIESFGNDDDLYAAAALDKAVNGTSLMIMFELGQARLLFTGDAQWGTWCSALADPQWRALLTQTNFLKVSHHGSHNATPADFVNILANDVNAMVSTRKTNRYPDIPRKPLLDELRKRVRSVVRSDHADLPDPDGFIREGDFYVEAVVSI